MPCSATIGFFDGVHKGHQYVINRLRTDAREHGLESTVITFRQHPRQVLSQDFIPKLLTNAKKKEQLLQATGVDNVVMMDFSKQLATLSAQEFMRLLHEEYGVVRLLIGYDNRFGHNRAEGFEDYQRYGKQMDIEVVLNDALEDGETTVSSSVVRRLLQEGKVEEANHCLGYDYGFEGLVVRGQGEGRKLGFPTANMQLSDNQLVPKRGVYAVRVRIEGYTESFLGMMNIGVRPTYGEFQETHEVNIFHFDADIYDKTISVEFLRRLRDERKFSSLEELRSQLHLDKESIIKQSHIK